MPEKPPAFQFYANDWLTDDKRTEMHPYQRGVHIDLMAYAWINGTVPADADGIAQVVGRTPAELKRYWNGRLLEAWPVVPDQPTRRWNPRLEEQRRTLTDFVDRQSKAGKRGADKRWHQNGNSE